MKLLTVGQIGKLKKASLKAIYEWALQVRKKTNVFGRGWGIILDKGDDYYRYLMPIEIVEKFPKIPDTNFIEKTIKKYEKVNSPDKRFTIILLGGNSIENKSWIEKIAKDLKATFSDIYIHYYKHWETGDQIINPDYELSKLSEVLADKKDYVIFAKSAGVLLTMKGVLEGKIKPEKCIFIGTPLNWARKNNFAIDEWIQKYNIYTLYIQHKNDPICSSKDLENYLSSNKRVNYTFMKIDGDTHDYQEYELLNKQVRDMVYKTKVVHGRVFWNG